MASVPGCRCPYRRCGRAAGNAREPGTIPPTPSARTGAPGKVIDRLAAIAD